MAGGRLGVYGDCGAPMEGTGGAHREHGDHVSDFGSVEVQRLIERRRILQSQKESTYTMRVERGGRRCVGRRGGVSRRADLWGRAQEERTLNMAHMTVTLDVSKVSGWLNADASCQGGHTMQGGGRVAIVIRPRVYRRVLALNM